jgi:hypothetical protein
VRFDTQVVALARQRRAVGRSKRDAIGGRRWWAGTLLMILGELGNLVAYSLAKPSLISPLGAVSVVVNVPVAYLVRGLTSPSTLAALDASDCCFTPASLYRTSDFMSRPKT